MANVRVAFGLFEHKSLEKANILGGSVNKPFLVFLLSGGQDSKLIPQILLFVDQ